MKLRTKLFISIKCQYKRPKLGFVYLIFSICDTHVKKKEKLRNKNRTSDREERETKYIERKKEQTKAGKRNTRDEHK